MGNAGTRTGVVIVFLLGTQFKAQVFDYTVINSTHSSIRQARHWHTFICGIVDKNTQCTTV